ncbi:tRNA (N(6)-L-threonylcarbamoyladenosine(37)-C(2))-methylthiotransferase, partial [Candidatus Woesearchaeota archaeon]|nr:tRNA (N(6)-L-threonylcarbamoyladenosine(37)-C(2))-methylthiotransferase [Candidatus Woesearchaeota archaeon]
YFKTHGCSTNFSESEVMMGLLKQAQFEIVRKPDEANVLVINVCTVKGESTALKSIRDTINANPNKRYIIAGCLTPELIKEVREITQDASLVNTNNLKEIVSVVEETIHDNPIEVLAGETEEIKICLPKIRRNPIIGIVPILSGCSNQCSYCSVKLVKGKLFSYPKEKIIEEVKNCLNDGCREIWVTSQDNAAYGMDKGYASLPELLHEIMQINKEFMVRLGMMNPNNVKIILDDLIDVYKNNKKLFKFLHLPLQSGNDEILGLMGRNYTADNFIDIVNKFKQEIPQITISTDIICGFPTETEEQFNDSLNLIKEIKPDVLNISRFQPRPRTKAAEMEQLDGGTVKDRSRVLTDIFGNISRMNNEKWLDWKGTVLIDEEGKEETSIGRNFAYKPVVLEGKFNPGDIVKVKVRKATPYDLRAQCLP